MTRFLPLSLAIALSACGTPSPVVTASTSAGVAKLSSDLDAVNAGCKEAVPLANLADIIPVVGTYIAAGVNIACTTEAGVNKLLADPSSATWLGTQIQMLKNALGKK